MGDASLVSGVPFRKTRDAEWERGIAALCEKKKSAFAEGTTLKRPSTITSHTMPIGGTSFNRGPRLLPDHFQGPSPTECPNRVWHLQYRVEKTTRGGVTNVLGALAGKNHKYQVPRWGKGSGVDERQTTRPTIPLLGRP